MKKSTDYIGYIKKNSYNDNSGKYLVYIPELMGTSDEGSKTILLPNETNSVNFSRWLDFNTKSILSSGSYFPLHEGMVVIVNFRGNTLESGYISKIVSYLPLVDSQENRDNFYLLNKTLKGSWIYQDDSRNFTHLMQNGGSTNIVMTDDHVTIQVGGTIQKNVFELSEDSTIMQFENSIIRMDSTGIKFSVGDSIFALTESGIILKSSQNIEIDAKSKLNLKSSKTKVQGGETLNLYGNVTRLSGAHQLNINANIVGINSTFLTSVESRGQVTIDSLVKTKITGNLLHLSSIGNVNLEGSVLTLSSQSTNISGTSLNISGSSIAMDGVITHGLGIASSLNASMTAMNTSLDISTDAANRAAVMALSMNDPITAITHNLMAQSLPGAAEMIGNIEAPLHTEPNAGSGVKEKIKYIINSNGSYNNIVEEQFVDLRSTHDIYI